jgi:kynurenine formamidase
MIVDLSHEIRTGMVTYPGLAPPEIRTVITRENSAARLASGVSFEIESLTLVGNTGTYLDSPYHFHSELADAGAALVGIDSLNIDNPTDPERPAHDRLLRAGIPIIEHLTNLGSVPQEGARLTALPAPVRGMASFPVRAVAVWAA